MKKRANALTRVACRVTLISRLRFAARVFLLAGSPKRAAQTPSTAPETYFFESPGPPQSRAAGCYVNRARQKKARLRTEGTSRILDPLYSSLFIFVANFILLIVRNLKYWRWPDITLLNDWNYIYIYFRNKEKLRQKPSRLICFSLRLLLFIYFSCFLYLFYKMLSFLLIISLFLYIFLLQFLLCFYNRKFVLRKLALEYQ